jgi:hypothetical protein
MVIASKLKLPGAEKADLLVFRRPQGRSFAALDRSTAAMRAQSGPRRAATCARREAVRGGAAGGPPRVRRGPLLSGRVALEGANRVVGEIELVALAHEQAEGTFAIAVVGGRALEAAAQDGEGRLELLVGVALVEGG